MSDWIWLALGIGSEVGGLKKRKKVHFERGEWYVKALGCNIQRQVRLMTGMTHEELEQIAGHKIDWSKYVKYNKTHVPTIAKEDLVMEIAEREGWRFYDCNEFQCDPYYRQLVGMEDRGFIYSRRHKEYPERYLMSPAQRDAAYRRYKEEAREKRRESIEKFKSSNSATILISFVVMFLGICIGNLPSCVISNLIIVCIVAFNNRLSDGGVIASLLIGLVPLWTTMVEITPHSTGNFTIDMVFYAVGVFSSLFSLLLLINAKV